MERRAKIVATLGPASQDAGTLDRLIAAGMNVARLNFSHGTHAEYGALIQRVRAAAERAGVPICILQDLQGPKIRVGDLPSGSVDLKIGDKVTLTTKGSGATGEAANGSIPVDFAELPRFVRKGGRILLDDGNLELETTAVKKDSVHATVIVGGILKSHKGINLPGAEIDIPGLTHKDEEPLHDFTYVPREQEIQLGEFPEGTTRTVKLHDGSTIVLKKLERDYDPADRAAAMGLIEETHSKGVFLTGLIYIEPEHPSLAEVYQLPKQRTLNRMSEKELRPAKGMIEKANAMMF